ncbi:MAG: putative toxin-antitoxin system toxin component, PIN family, partial [Bacteroidota bacterium]
MQKIIIDTNVLVSSLIQKSFPHLILNLVIDRKVEVCLSNELLEEYYAVLR